MNVKMTCDGCREIGRQCRECRKRYLREYERAHRERRRAQKRESYQRTCARLRAERQKAPKPSPWKHGEELVRVAVPGWGYLG
jgi:hypothetical protein